MKKIWVGAVIFSLFFLDQLTKYCFYNLGIGKEFVLLEPVFNTGISWGIGVNLWLIIVLSFLGGAAFIWLWNKKYLKDWEFIFLFAGTLGNLIDRILLHGVRDFISVGNFPVFNLADCFLTVGVCIVLCLEISSCIHKKKI